MTQPLARLEGIEKRFGAVRALAGARLEVRAGEVHGVLGENGAGKSTLLSILGGMLRPDSGLVEVGGVPVTLRSPREAWAAGIGLVHQHFTLVPRLTVLENLALGRRDGASGWRLPLGAVRSEVAELSVRIGMSVPLDVPAGSLGVGARQRAEILKALLRRPRMLVLDEPTATLAPDEVDALFALLRTMAGEGRAIVLVAHKLDEILGVADRVTVLRRGVTVLEAPRVEVDGAALIRAMVGSESFGGGAPVDRGERTPGAVVARLEGAVVSEGGARPALDGVTLDVRRGEILGVAGVEGNGQRELALVLAGRRAVTRGITELPPEAGFVPQDRTREGLVGSLTLFENVALTLGRLPAFATGQRLRWDAVRARTRELMARFDVRAPSPATRAWTLSGGNQQRLVVARELEVAHDLLVVENPTRGLDVGAAAFVHARLRELADRPGGPAIVLVSTDLDEVLELADRVVVMVRGRLVPVDRTEHTREGVGRHMMAAADA